MPRLARLLGPLAGALLFAVLLHPLRPFEQAAPAAAGADAPAGEPFSAPAFYRERCAECHGPRRYGGYAPPLTPRTLGRKSDESLRSAILAGLPNTQMPAFGEVLDEPQAGALLAMLREPVDESLWGLSDIRESRVELEIGSHAIPPEIRRENLILVVERGTGSVVVLDGDSMRELDRFEVGRIHGGVKFDGAFHQALAATRDGTVADYDLDRGALRTKVKVGVNTRNIAVSSDGSLVAAANQLPQGLVVLDGRLRPLEIFPMPGQPSAVYQLPRSPHFVMTLRDLPHLYTISQPGLELKKTLLPEPFEDFVFVPGQPRMVASSRGGSRLLLYDYEKQKVEGSLDTEGLPHLFSASFFERDGKLHAAFNHMGVPRLSVIEMEKFERVREIPLLGAGYFTRTHPGTPYLWIDTNTEAIQLVEKSSLELLERRLIPEPGKKAMHVEFTSAGDKALLSVWDAEGAVVIYDSGDLEEIARLPFAMPVGKYNAANKTRPLR